MTTIASLDFDGTVEGAPLVVSAPWSNAGVVPVTVAAAASHGDRGARYASTNVSTSLRYDLAAATTAPLVLSFYFRLATLPTASHYIAYARDNADTVIGEIRLSATGALQMRVAGTTVGSASPPISPNTLYRMEWRMDPSTGTATFRVYLGDSETIWDTRTTTSWPATAIDSASVGIRSAASGGTNFDVDSIVIADDWTGHYTGSPLQVNAGVDQDIEITDDATMDATVSGGSTPYDFAWTVISGSGSFDNAAIQNPVFTPSAAGVHQLRLTVTDDSSTVLTDDIVVRVVGPLAPTAASGWTSLGGGAPDRLTALVDSDVNTYVQTGPNPAGEILTITLPPMEPPIVDLAVRVSLSTDIGVASVVARLYRPNGTTLVSTATALTATTTVNEQIATFSLTEIEAADLDSDLDWGAGMVVTLTAAV